MPHHFKMGTVAEDRAHVLQNAISFEDALRVFRDWHSGLIPVQASFLGKAGFSGTVRGSVDGLVTLVDPKGIVTVSGDGSEIKLDLRVCEFSCAREAIEQQDARQLLDSDSALQLTFPNGAVCLVYPCRQVSSAPDSQRPGSLQWPQNKLGSPSVQSNSMSGPPIDLCARPLVRRNLLVDVGRGQVNIVEIAGTGSGRSRIRRLKEQFLSRADRMQADRLKRQIVYGENGGAYNLDGLYRPKTEPSFNELVQLIEELERHDGPHAWDRRRHTR